MRRSWLISMFILITILVAACSDRAEDVNGNENGEEDDGGGTEQQGSKEGSDQVTIKIAYSFGEESFHGRFDHIDDKLPNINIEYVPYENTLESLQEIFANNVNPDIIIQYNDMTPVKELDVIEPIDDLAVEFGFDIDTLRPSLVSYIRSLDEEGRLIGLPDGSSHIALYYNKEIFDLFGVEYPVPDKIMTWDEVFELAAKMTGERDGVEYVGFEFSWGNTGAAALTPLNELALNKTDPQSGEILLNDRPEFKQYFDLMDKLYRIPGIYEQEREGACLFCEKKGLRCLSRQICF